MLLYSSKKQDPFVKYAGLVSNSIFCPMFNYLDRHPGAQTMSLCALLSTKHTVSAW